MWFGTDGGGGRSGPSIVRNLSDTKRNICDGFCSDLCLQLRQQRGLEERELLQPDRIPDDEIEFFETNLGRPGMRRRGLAHEVMPAMLQPKFQQSGFQTEPFRKP